MLDISSERMCRGPRSKIARGDVAAVETLRKIGKEPLDARVLFDIWPDDQFPPERAARYAKIVDTDSPPSTVIAGLPARRSRFEAPGTTGVSASRPASTVGEIDLHLVNYNRAELSPGPDGTRSLGARIADEKPVAVSDLIADIALLDDAALRTIRFLTPERPDERAVQPTESPKGRVRFNVPKFFVYGVARIRYRSAP